MARFIRLGFSTVVGSTFGLILATYFLTTYVTKRNAFNDLIDKLSQRAEFLGPVDNKQEDPFPEEYWPEKALPRQVKNQANATILIRNPRPYDVQPQNFTVLERIGSSEKIRQDFKSRAPQAIILGFAKCGTSAIIEFLALHSKIVALDWEPDYFCDRVYPKYQIQWYIQRMPPSYPDQITIEKSPCYIIEHDAHIRIAAFNSSIKLLVLVRHPITRLLSTYAHFKSVDSYWGLGSKSIEQRFFDKQKDEFRTDEVLRFTEYYSHFEHLLKHFPREQILIVDGDKLITDPLTELNKVQDFLGLKREITNKDIYYDENKKFYCMRKRISTQAHCLGDHKGRQHDSMEPDFRKRMLDFLKPYNDKFFKLVGQQFDWED